MIIYVEKKTNLLYEVQLFEDFAMVKMASPGLENTLKRLSLEEFGRDFNEFWGNPDEVQAYLEQGLSSTEVN